MRHCPCANKQKRRNSHAKTTSAKLYIYIGVGSRDLLIDEAHTALGIFPVFFLHAAYSALRHFCLIFYRNSTKIRDWVAEENKHFACPAQPLTTDRGSIYHQRKITSNKHPIVLMFVKFFVSC